MDVAISLTAAVAVRTDTVAGITDQGIVFDDIDVGMTEVDACQRVVFTGVSTDNIEPGAFDSGNAGITASGDCIILNLTVFTF